MAYAFLIANTYIDEVVKRGYDANAFAGRISYNLNIYGNLWEQVAKFRAGRKVWATNLRERYGITKDSDLMLKGLFAGGGSGLMKAEPENNIMRGAFYGLAAALSGAQSTALCSFDEAYTIPTERSALLSLRTLQIIMEEVGLRDTVDPLAGSYFIETITKQMEDKIWEEMKEIEARGGMLASVKDGFVGRKLARQAYEWEMGIEHGELIKVGVNKYVTGREEEVQLHEYNDRWQVDQIANLAEVRRTRDAKLVVGAPEGPGRRGHRGHERHAVSQRVLPGLLHRGRDVRRLPRRVRSLPRTERHLRTERTSMAYKIGIDVGGTFTDFLLAEDDGTSYIYKVLSTPKDPSIATIRGIEEMAKDRDMATVDFLKEVSTIVHGTTVTTNATLTYRGAKTGLLTTEGVRDALEMRRGIREEQYNNRYENARPVVERYLRRPVNERLDYAGSGHHPARRGLGAHGSRVLEERGLPGRRHLLHELLRQRRRTSSARPSWCAR